MYKYILPALLLISFPVKAEMLQSKTYEITGRVISIKSMRPYGGPPMQDECYKKHHNTSYNLVTMWLGSEPKITKDGMPIQGLETKPAPKYYSFALDDKSNSFMGQPDLGKVQEYDSFTADVNYSTDECLNEAWISNLQFGGRMLNK